MTQITNAQVKKFLDLFELKFRKPDEKNYEDREPFYVFTRDALGTGSKERPEEQELISDAMHKLANSIHGDTVYEETVGCLNWLSEVTGEEPVDEDTLQDQLYERVASSVDCYTSDLTAWLNLNCHHVYYLTEALEEGLACNDGFALLEYAQNLCYKEIWQSILQVLLDDAEEQS